MQGDCDDPDATTDGRDRTPTAERAIAMAEPVDETADLTATGPLEPQGRFPQLWAVNLVSDPIHGYLELTKGLAAERAADLGLPPERATEGDIVDSPWVQRMRRISQLQSARWVFPTAEHSRFTHSLGVMHEAGLWGRQLYPSLAAWVREHGAVVPSEGLVVESVRLAGLLHDVGHGPFAHFFEHHFLDRFPAPPDARTKPGKALSHEDLSRLIVERELGELIREIRRAPGLVPERDAFGPGESIDPGWISFLISKPPIADPSMPGWLRLLQPLFSGVFTVDNLDYVRRDAYLTGVSAGIVDVERLRRYSVISRAGLSLFEAGLGALEMHLTARLFMYQQVYLHRTVRAIDLDLAEVFRPSVVAIFGDASPAEALSAYADLDEYALLHQAARWTRGEALADEPQPGDGTVRPEIAEAWRHVLLRQPRWRSEAEIRLSYECDDRDSSRARAVELLGGPPASDRLAIDLAEVDARPASAASTDALLAVVGRGGAPAIPVSQALERLPAFSLIARRYARIDRG